MKSTFKILPIVAIMSAAWAAQAQQVAYAPEMIRALVPDGQDIDMSFFERGYEIGPGTYQFTVELNGDRFKIGNYEIREFQGGLEPVLRVKDILALPLKEDVLAKFKGMSDNEEIFPLSLKIKDARASVDTQDMRIEISIPQIYLAHDSGWVDVTSPDLWDYGETAAIFNYSLSGSHMKSHDSDYNTTNLNANLTGQFNFGPWRLYTSGSMYSNSSKGYGTRYTNHEWDLWNTYLQRDIPTWKGTLQVGELSTSGELFDSIPIRGIRVSSNEQMLPYRDRTYAPVIEGIANSNAQILVRQNGHVVYTLNVAPGPFKLEDIPGIGNFGDLEVVIRESDGTERIINVPFSTVPNMLREGQYRYDVNAGKYYQKGLAADVKTPNVFMGTLAYGLPENITVFGGSILSEDYMALAFGTGMSLGKFGALAGDVIHTRYGSDDERGLKAGSGAAWRIRYEKNLMNTGTAIHLANYQYLTGNYATLEDFVTYGTSQSTQWWGNGKIRSRWQLSMSQSLSDFGSLNVGAEYAQYHGTAADTKTFNIGYSTGFKGIGVSLNYSRNYIRTGSYGNKDWSTDQTLMLNLNIPLSLFFKNVGPETLQNTSLGYQGSMYQTDDGKRAYQQSVVMNGYDNDLNTSWTISQELGNHLERSTSVMLGYRGNRFAANAGVNYNHSITNYHLGMTGALVLHKTGITATPYAYDSVAVVEVPDAEGVKVSNSLSTETDMFGHGIITYLSNYTKNEFSIDPATLPDGAILLDSTNRVVVPTQGAVVRVNYPVRFGQQAVFVLKSKDGLPLPFGASVDLIDNHGEKDLYVSGIIGEGGRVFLSGLTKQGTLQVKNGDRQYLFEYELQNDKPLKSENFVPIQTIELMSK